MNTSTSSADLLLDSVFRTSQHGIVVCRALRDPAGQVIDFQVIRCNERAAEIVHVPRERMLTETMLTIDPEGINSGIFVTYCQVAETGLPMHIEHHYAEAGIWMTQSLARSGDADVLASWTDITSQKRVEQEKLHQAELLQAILDNTESGIAVMESVRDAAGTVTDFRFTHINPAAEWITQRKKETLVGELYSTAWPKARQNGVIDWHLRVVQTRTPLKINGVNLPVGEYNGWYNIRIRPFGDGVIATFVDVTALKQAEFANQHQAELLRSVLDNSLNPIIAFSAIRDKMTGQIIDFRYEAQNEASRRDVDRTDEEVIGHTMLEYFPHVIETGLFDRYVRVIETGQSERFEQEYNYDKLTGWSEMTVSKWGDGIVLTLVSITESRDRQQQLEQVNRELLNANENLRQFAHVASHDLQEPLRKITAFSDILQDQFSPLLGDHGKDIISRMRSATERMSTLISDVLAYSRISTYREPFQPVALNQLLTDVCYELKSNVQETGSIIDIHELPVVQGDRNQLYHLFINLLSNALKFQPGQQPAIIGVTCQTVTGNDGPPELETDRDYYEISLTDNGIGFDSKYTELIFQVFQRLHSRQQYTGTGMGLAICKRVIENHRGAIVATSLPGQGATFRVYLPT